MDNIEILLNEYSNLWHEKIIHKESMRKLRGYVSYLTTIVSLSLTFMGMSTTDIFKNGLNNTVSPVFVKNFSDVFILISIPFTPIVLLIGSFALSDLFHTFVIAFQIGNIEQKINSLSGDVLLKWEHLICPIIYGEGHNIKQLKNYNPTTNIIKMDDFLIFVPFVASLCLITIVFGGKYIYEKNAYIFGAYIAVNVYFLISFIWIATKLFSYGKAESPLRKAISILNSARGTSSNEIQTK